LTAEERQHHHCEGTGRKLGDWCWGQIYFEKDKGWGGVKEGI